MNTFGQRVKSIRQARGFTQAQLAAAAGVSQAAVGKIEIGLASRSRYSTAIANALSVNPAWLAEGDGSIDASISRVETKPYKAHQYVKQAVRDGYLPRPTTLLCLDCGAPAQVYDHRDYNKPLDVEPVCHACNVKRGPALPFVHVNDR